MRTKKLFLVLAALAVLGLALGGIANGVFRNADSPSAFPDVHSPASRLATVARFPSEPGSPERQVVLQRTPDGYLCLWDSPDATARLGVGGCNPASDPLAGHELFVSLAYDGGPAVDTVRDARLSGLLAAHVDRVQVLMSDGSTRRVALSSAPTRSVADTDYRSFAYRIRQSDLRRGVTPVAVLALDATGAEIDRQTTGVGQ